jgi:CubicO group peptidase (beta-lactamase class C family)
LKGWDEGSGRGEPMFAKATKKIALRRLLTHSAGTGYEFLSLEIQRWWA